MLKISSAGCFGLFPATVSQFTVEMCAAAKNCQKIHQNLSFWGSRSSMLTNLKSTSPVLFYNMQQVCTYLQPFSHCKSQ